MCPLLTYGMYIEIVLGRTMVMKLIKHVILHKQIRKLIEKGSYWYCMEYPFHSFR